MCLLLRVLLVSTLFSFLLIADTTKEGLAYLNSLRTNAGLIELRSVKELNNATKLHAKYIIQNQTAGHYEKKGKYSYRGRTPSSRAINAGYPSRVSMENISLNASSQKKSIDNLFSAIYHRFVFLNLDKDEIGLGKYSTKKKRRIKHAYVYSLGSSSISNLCKKSYPMIAGQYYRKNICKNSKKMIPQSIYNEKTAYIEQKNAGIILYPYKGQDDIWPSFYNESPDPLPKYKVSGFPISVQFNPSFYKRVKLTSFKLYDENGKEIKKTKILQHKNDHNHLLTKHEFALMPLARLEFNSTYTAIFEGKVDGHSIKRKWSFKTTRFKEMLYRVNKSKSTLSVKAGSTIILYMVPANRRDILSKYTARGKVKAIFLDQNTLKVTLPKYGSVANVSLQFGKYKKVSFLLQ